jgi:lipopolysaccharide export system protein LptA
MILLSSMVAVGHAEDAKPAAPASAPNALFQSLSLGSGKGPVRIDSDSLELDYKNSNITYRGHVQVTQGDVTLNSDRLSITYDPAAVKRDTGLPDAATRPQTGTDADRIKQIVAEGNVRIRQGNRLAEGRRAIFDQAQQTVVLSDGAVLHEGPNQVAGERVIVYLKEERSVVEGGSNTRVKAVLYPGKSDTEGKATALPIQAADSPPTTVRP